VQAVNAIESEEDRILCSFNPCIGTYRTWCNKQKPS